MSLRHFFPLCLFRHGGGGCDLHRQGAAQRHEHLQSKAQGTVMWDGARHPPQEKTQTNIWSLISRLYWLCLLKGCSSFCCSCSGSDHTNQTLLDMNDSSGENMRATPSKTQLKLSTDTFRAGNVSWFTCSSQSRCEGDVCLLRGGRGGVQFLPQAKLSRSPQQLENRTQAPYFFLEELLRLFTDKP